MTPDEQQPQREHCEHEDVCRFYVDIYPRPCQEPDCNIPCKHDTRSSPHPAPMPWCYPGCKLVSDAKAEAARKAREEVLDELSLPRDAVLRFSRIMETKLKEKDGQRDGWEDCDPLWLFERAEEEMKELKKEITVYMNHSSLSPKWLVIKERIQREAADVANFCMMISDNMEPESLRPKGEP